MIKCLKYGRNPRMAHVYPNKFFEIALMVLSTRSSSPHKTTYLTKKKQLAPLALNSSKYAKLKFVRHADSSGKAHLEAKLQRNT